jgi:PIN domain nuclease of toxin-antitoxin system
MRLLLDTHIVLWALAGHVRLPSEAKRLIEVADVVYVSAASVWEVAIKQRLGKLEVRTADLLAGIDQAGFVELPVRAVHAARVAELELIHTDPFDRLLIAQAIVEPLRLLTVDASLQGYTDLVTLVA